MRSPLDDDIAGAWTNKTAYQLAIEVGDYRAAARESIWALRRLGQSGTESGGVVAAQWQVRLRGCLRSRHRHKELR